LHNTVPVEDLVFVYSPFITTSSAGKRISELVLSEDYFLVSFSIELLIIIACTLPEPSGQKRKEMGSPGGGGG